MATPSFRCSRARIFPTPIFWRVLAPMGSKCCCEEEKVGQKDFAMPPALSEDQVCLPKVAELGKQPQQVAKKGEGEKTLDLKSARFFQFVVEKTGPEDKLGMDVKHISSRLEVANIFPEGAIARTNLQNKTKSPSGETLQIGDLITKVNNVELNDHQMVAEVRLRDKLTMVVARLR
eukprot:CAMPEP_0177518674 /NCGR_PEP_ID=MMETSP0369-20130122/46657_1 /TAXON_ID=447022 ORGANISM="Scrippsiella hangoei-like, Strain SHHI-4" /NCGR_SAMPLE_ID=MMETSP0369 /ASSEMBLY_ACC=CAM_ASM_000364 /LENGTH=175 /DNA_ID=CAMNT_0018997809 /DNA_START=23 /DNA_END=550 /DNA_ORIENTATION=+